MQNWLLATLSLIILSGCASVNSPQVTVNTNIPFFYSSGITVRNSAGSNIVIVPQSLGNGFVAEYKKGKWQWSCLCYEKIVTKLVELKNGETITLQLYRNTSNRTVRFPFAVKVIERGKVLGSYSYSVSVYPGQDNYLEFNFGPRELRALKQGNTGYQCRNNGFGW